MNQTTLFGGKDLRTALRAHRESVPEAVSNIPAGKFVTADTQDLIEQVLQEISIIPVKLDQANKCVTLREGKVVTSIEQESSESESKPTEVMGTQVDVEIPLAGDGWLLIERKPDPRYSTRPKARMERGCLRIMFGLTDSTDLDTVRKEYENSIAVVAKFFSDFNDIVYDYNRELREVVSKELKNRLERLKRIKDIKKIFAENNEIFGFAS